MKFEQNANPQHTKETATPLTRNALSVTCKVTWSECNKVTAFVFLVLQFSKMIRLLALMGLMSVRCLAEDPAHTYFQFTMPFNTCDIFRDRPFDATLKVIWYGIL